MSMHETIFRYQDDDGDAVEVEHIKEGVSPIGRRLIIEAKGDEGDQVQVALSREEGIKMARAILAALGKDADGAYTPEGLESLPEGSRVEDEDGDIWVKNPDGAWHCPLEDVYAGSTGLVKAYGPITLKGGSRRL